MIKGFKEFLLKNNVLALAVAVIVGGAVGKVVSSLAADILMPLIGMVLPAGDWRKAEWVLASGPDGKAISAMVIMYTTSAMITKSTTLPNNVP